MAVNRGANRKIEISGPVSQKEGGALAALWRKILKENNYMHILDMLVDRYLSKNDEFDGRVKRVKQKAKSTLVANVTSDDMTIKTFFDLLFNFLNVKKVNISIKLTFNNNQESVHSVTVSNNEEEGRKEQDEKSK